MRLCDSATTTHIKPKKRAKLGQLGLAFDEYVTSRGKAKENPRKTQGKAEEGGSWRGVARSSCLSTAATGSFTIFGPRHCVASIAGGKNRNEAQSTLSIQKIAIHFAN